MADIDAARRRRAFRRRTAAATAGIHLPTTSELLQGMPFMRDLETDSQTFAERLLPRLDTRSSAELALHHLLVAFTLHPQQEDYRAAAEAFRQFANSTGKRIKDPADASLRCSYYAAAAGCIDSARLIGFKALARARDRRTPADETLSYATSALGWLIVSFWSEESWRAKLEEPKQSAWGQGAILLQRLFDAQVEQLAESGVDEPGSKPREEPDDGPSSLEAAAIESGSPGVIVVRVLGDTDLAGGKHIVKEFKSVAGVRLPLVPLPDLAEVRRRLVNTFPHAGGVADVILDALVGQPHVRFRPIILVGSPGCGKTTFASTLLDHLGIPHEVFPCGGTSDSTIGGTARRWSSGEPSLPLALVRRSLCASPGIVLDELEKTGTSRHNGTVSDVLLGLFEPQSSVRWFDPYIQAATDLSYVVWVATANTLEGIQVPLRDRCRILRFPDPGPEHLPIIAAHLLKAQLVERGLDARWSTPLTAFELEALTAAWPGGSIRALGRLVEGVVKAREASISRQ
jgi:hypothetical protein